MKRLIRISYKDCNESTEMLHGLLIIEKIMSEDENK